MLSTTPPPSWPSTTGKAPSGSCPDSVYESCSGVIPYSRQVTCQSEHGRHAFAGYRTHGVAETSVEDLDADLILLRGPNLDVLDRQGCNAVSKDQRRISVKAARTSWLPAANPAHASRLPRRRLPCTAISNVYRISCSACNRHARMSVILISGTSCPSSPASSPRACALSP